MLVMKEMPAEKILILRFSSFGDVTQCLSALAAIKNRFPTSDVHWVTRKDMAPLIQNHPQLARLWLFDRKSGLRGLWHLSLKLRGEKFTHVYDAHNNLRTWFIVFVLGFFRSFQLIRRPLYRWKRFLLFRFRKNLFQMPFSGQRDLLQPLKAWDIPETLPPTPQVYFDKSDTDKATNLLQGWTDFIALAPSAAYFLKRWPKEYWEKLIDLFPNQKFVLIGGPEDRFLDDIAKKFPGRVLNVSGLSDLGCTIALMNKARAVVSNDSGPLHVAEQLGKKTIALMGPAPFGFPSRPSTRILELNLNCRPCSKHGQGPCINASYHQCLVGIEPSLVEGELRRLIEI